ncbi:MAG: UDP-phosphate N-acetylglucosaminyl 1-phosphate transferase [Betaproteobacteria bacterium]|nr:UDP-phosphate N-acetylglucosaminyl 1-phosphate transferase [Betaproteobacteria bacterium]
MTLAGALAAAFAIALGVIAFSRRTFLAKRLQDQPNARSLHVTPRPRIGGLGVMAGSLTAIFAGCGPDLRIVAACALGLALLSLADDLRALPASMRLAGHAAAALVVVLGPLGSPPLAIAVPCVLALVWMTNLYNFMDGADGLAGGMAVAGFGAMALAADAGGAADLALAAGSLAAASLAFLAFNAPPAKVFLGDAGSIPLGFLAGALGALGIARGVWPWWFPLLAFSPFWVDATVTLLRRLAAREKVWVAHRTHYYQRLVTGGWSHRRLAFAAWAVMLAAGACALLALEGPVMLHRGILALWVVAYVVALVAIDRRHPRRTA